MEYHLGHFVWRELMTNDLDRARAFYTALLGWEWESMQMSDSTYWVAKVGGQYAGGMMKCPDKAMPPFWGTYVSVENVDRVCETATSNGGTIVMPPMDVPGVGRLGAMQDPQGAVIMFMRAETGDGPMPEQPGAGTFCWETLNTTDVDAAVSFYTKVFPFKKDEFGGMPALSGLDGKMVADVEKAPPGVPPHWLLHVAVEDLAAMRAKVQELGGTILMPEVPIPNVGTLCIINDPTGATLSLFQPAPH